MSQDLLRSLLMLIPKSTLPVNTVAPAVTPTNPSTGTVLSTTNGTWTGSPTPTYTYQWQHGTTNISGKTSSTYTCEAAYAGETIRCVVTATNAAGAVAANSNSTSALMAVGQQVYTAITSANWTCPAGVYSVSVVVIGTANGSAGALAYKNSISVTPGANYPVVVTDDGFNVPHTLAIRNSFNGDAEVSAGFATARTGTGGGDGNSSWGGGAGGYAGTGGSTNQSIFDGYQAGTAGTGGAGGGGGAYDDTSGSGSYGKGGGGGTGLLGQGSSGAGGTVSSAIGPATGGGAGSGGSEGATSTSGNQALGGNYGGAMGDGSGTSSTNTRGAVRIIWPGSTRSFPSTNTGDM